MKAHNDLKYVLSANNSTLLFKASDFEPDCTIKQNQKYQSTVAVKRGTKDIQGDQKSCLGSEYAVFTSTRDNSSGHPVQNVS